MYRADLSCQRLCLVGACKLGSYKGAVPETLGMLRSFCILWWQWWFQETAHDKMPLNCTHTIAMPTSCYDTVLELNKYTVNGENWVKGRWDLAVSCSSFFCNCFTVRNFKKGDLVNKHTATLPFSCMNALDRVFESLIQVLSTRADRKPCGLLLDTRHTR